MSFVKYKKLKIIDKFVEKTKDISYNILLSNTITETTETITETTETITPNLLFTKIKEKVDEHITLEFILSTKTNNGNTQLSERVVIQKIREILDSMSLEYEEAGSQQSKDFRNVGNIGLNIEIKKTDSLTLYFNDTCPNKDIYYIILFTGKEYKRKVENNIKPQILYINGNDFIEESPWLEEFNHELTVLKDKYARGENKKKLSGIMEVYPRPTYKANIRKFIH